MNRNASKRQRTLTMIVYSLLAVWCAACFALGIANIGETFAVVCIVAGAVNVAIVVTAALMRSWMSALYGVLLATAMGMIAGGAVMSDWITIGMGVLAVTIVGAAAPLTLALREMTPGGGGASVSETAELRDLMQRIHEHIMLSDSAKRVLFREREMGLLRDAIEADIAEGKYNVALTLCEEMASVFGHVNEAETFRASIMQARQEHFDRDARAAMEQLDELLEQRNWAMAHHEASRIRRLFGDSHLIEDLDQRILRAREEHKRELEAQFLEAARRDDVEGAMALLKELDRYLGKDEAVRLSEVAQGVVVRHRENLGVQFKLAVNDHRWAEAARMGEAIIDEFPNTKMAEEVRSMIDLLRTRATQAAISQDAGF